MTTSPRPRGASRAWRATVPVVAVLAGLLFVTTANSSGGTDLRPGRTGDLATLVRRENARVEELRAELATLEAEVERLTTAVRDGAVDTERERADELRLPVGLEPVRGPGVTVVLDDAPDLVIESTDIGSSKLIVHQQDIQAVVNAMWAGGAEAMTIQGQRVISTTGIKCVGNTVVLHGVPYSPPYVITAVGDPDAILSSINASHYITIYKQYVEAYQLGWAVDAHSEVTLPAYTGPVDLDYARTPASPTGESGDS